MAELVCRRCGRTAYVEGKAGGRGNVSAGVYAYVVHNYYGCDSGCCGHSLYLCDADDHIVDEDFVFDHPYDENRDDFCRDLVESY